MTYYDGNLRPPTDGDMKNRTLPLERINIEYANRTGKAYLHQYEPTIIELITFASEWGIPMSRARIVYGNCGSHEVLLDWSSDE